LARSSIATNKLSWCYKFPVRMGRAQHDGHYYLACIRFYFSHFRCGQKRL